MTEVSKMITVEPPVPGVDGVKDEIAVKIASILEKGGRYFGSAGASLTHHVNNPEYESDFGSMAMSVGMEGERATSSLVRRWAEDKPEAVLLDSVRVRGVGKQTVDEKTGVVDGGDTDHVLIIGDEVILIDTKRWKSRRRYSVSDKGTVLRQGRAFPGGRVHAKQAKFLWKKYLHRSARMSSFVVINAEKSFVQYDDNWKRQQFRLITIEKLAENLDKIYERIKPENKGRINSTLVAQVAVCCIKPFDSYQRVFNMDSLNEFRGQ